MNAYSVLPLIVTVPLTALLAAFGVLPWGVVLAVTVAVGVLALAIRSGGRRTPRTGG
ncbi:hypothetical protein ACFXOD_02965 [Streptomyces sp. NPDC059161]|uniref:hypothetical protein n=1 Tax=Streptomyces sp. NPDC059161 TaxID=3346749 RepID=UPI0036A42F5F